MNLLTRRLPLCKHNLQENPDYFLHTEWLVTNGLGGYASSSISGVATRKYHGLLIAALPPPFGRTIMLNHLFEQVSFQDGQWYSLGCEEKLDGGAQIDSMQYLHEFRLEEGLPVWIFEIGEFLIEKRIWLVHMQNSVHISYCLLSGDKPVSLRLRPSLHFRPHEAPVNTILDGPYVVKASDHDYEVSQDHYPPLRFKLEGQRACFTLDSRHVHNIFYRLEASRGYESSGDWWTPGYFKVDLHREVPTTLIASTENWESIQALPSALAMEAEHERRQQLLHTAPPIARADIGAELVLAADQFIITPASRIEDAARARAAGDEVRTIIAGYHWFTDWGRDTMISLEGLTLSTGRHQEARWILRTFAHYVKDGLIPNMFPEGQKSGLYHTADATLWFFHATSRYVTATQDWETLRFLLPVLKDIITHHFNGTHFGIGVDPTDGLLRQGAEGYQLTWMDAKVGDWVVTPRRGKAVEINALWYNALRLLEDWLRREHQEEAALVLQKQADLVYQSFNARFWYAKGGYLYDVIDEETGEDAACRPNQVFAISLEHSVLDPSHWVSVMDTVQRDLLTPYGLRSLSPNHPDYRARYDGDLRARDAAYHQGTVWAWLIGPFIDAWLKIHPHDIKTARGFLQGFVHHMKEAGVGSISEVFDATPPYMPRGCIAQAWSVAEVLRCWIKTSD